MSAGSGAPGPAHAAWPSTAGKHDVERCGFTRGRQPVRRQRPRALLEKCHVSFQVSLCVGSVELLRCDCPQLPGAGDAEA